MKLFRLILLSLPLWISSPGASGQICDRAYNGGLCTSCKGFDQQAIRAGKWKCHGCSGVCYGFGYMSRDYVAVADSQVGVAGHKERKPIVKEESADADAAVAPAVIHPSVILVVDSQTLRAIAARNPEAASVVATLAGLDGVPVGNVVRTGRSSSETLATTASIELILARKGVPPDEAAMTATMTSLPKGAFAFVDYVFEAKPGTRQALMRFRSFVGTASAAELYAPFPPVELELVRLRGMTYEVRAAR